MDHDAQATRIGAIERFLDAQAPGWRDSPRWLGVARDGRGPLHAPLHVDEEQTARDRAALGLDKGELSGTGDQAGQKTVEDQQNERRDQVLRDLEQFKNTEGVPEWDGTESTDQLEGILTTARAREAGGGMASTTGAAIRGGPSGFVSPTDQGRPGIDDSSAQRLKEQGGPTGGVGSGSAVERPSVLDTPHPNTMPPSQEVALGAANASPETNAALQTQQDPARAERAEQQRDQKVAAEESGADVRPAR